MMKITVRLQANFQISLYLGSQLPKSIKNVIYGQFNAN